MAVEQVQQAVHTQERTERRPQTGECVTVPVGELHVCLCVSDGCKCWRFCVRHETHSPALVCEASVCVCVCSMKGDDDRRIRVSHHAHTQTDYFES